MIPSLFSIPLIFFSGVDSDSQVLYDWNNVMLEAVREESIGPNLAVRNFAILYGSTFDSLNAVEKKYNAYHFKESFPAAEPSPDAIAAGSCYTIATSLHPSRKGSFDKLVKPYLSNSASSRTRRSFSFGAKVARSFLELRKNDGSSTSVTDVPTTKTGKWQRTPPRDRPPVQPHWRNVKPFCLDSTNPFLAPPPPQLDSKEYLDALIKVKLLGSKQSKVRTREQKNIAKFWSDFSYSSTPPGHWNEIATFVARTKKLNLLETARLLALLNFTMADAGIAAFETKYRYRYWRPIQAIRQADEIKETSRLRDPSWDSLLESPSHPEYVSGHSCYSGSAARLLALFFKTDDISFIAFSDARPEEKRTFHSFEKCAEEIGMSRIYGGIHYEFSNRAGLEMGRKIADHTFTHFLNQTL
ncbi:MAG: vanadium-dependent haloperoxidase [Opitutae bacterium]|nr:vanadium-dependent haloperoxidase [Opitutae bacterium]